MFTSRFIGTIAAGVLALSATSCGESDEPIDAAAFGTLTIPLETQVNGIHYRLSGDSFVLSGPVNGTLQHNGSGAIVYAVVPPGSYDVELLDGWALERSGDSGFEPVAAELVSANPRAIEIRSGETTIATWMFRTAGEAIALEPGTFQGNLTVIDASNPGDTVFGDVAVDEQEQLDALQGIVAIEGSLFIGGSVASLSALTALTRIEGDLVIDGTDLGALHGLDQLVEIGGGLSITDNLALPTCAAQQLADALATAGASPDPVIISGNDAEGSCL